MQIQEQKQGAVTVIRPIGPLTESDAEQFLERLRQVHTQTTGRFVVDASSVPYVDSRGLEALLDANDQLAESGRSLKLCGVNETLREVLDLTELGPMFEQFDDSSSAVRSFL